jgi:hypothetical protein
VTAIAPDVLVTTRRSLHGVAETVVASSQFHATGRSQLRWLPARALGEQVAGTQPPEGRSGHPITGWQRWI